MGSDCLMAPVSSPQGAQETEVTKVRQALGWTGLTGTRDSQVRRRAFLSSPLPLGLCEGPAFPALGIRFS